MEIEWDFQGGCAFDLEMWVYGVGEEGGIVKTLGAFAKQMGSKSHPGNLSPKGKYYRLWNYSRLNFDTYVGERHANGERSTELEL